MCRMRENEQFPFLIDFSFVYLVTGDDDDDDDKNRHQSKESNYLQHVLLRIILTDIRFFLFQIN